MDAFDLEGIDEVIHGRLRLGIMAFLSSAQSSEFTTLRTRLNATDGNLSVHLRKLEDADYVRLDKSFVGRKPLTRVLLTEQGRAAYERYLTALGDLVGLNGQAA